MYIILGLFEFKMWQLCTKEEEECILLTSLWKHYNISLYIFCAKE